MSKALEVVEPEQAYAEGGKRALPKSSVELF